MVAAQTSRHGDCRALFVVELGERERRSCAGGGEWRRRSMYVSAARVEEPRGAGGGRRSNGVLGWRRWLSTEHLRGAGRKKTREESSGLDWAKEAGPRPGAR